MKRKGLLLTCLAALFIISTIPVSVRSTPDSPKLYVDPPSVGITACCHFTVDIKIANVTDMWGYEFKLTWDSSYLEVPDDPGTFGTVEGVAEGPFLKWGGPQPPEATRITSQANQTTGTLQVTATILGNPLDPFNPAYPASGNGTLATITFHEVSGPGGSSTLHLSNTHVYVLDPITLLPVETDHTREDGSYTGDVGYEVKIHETTVSKTIVCQGYPVKINATIHNVGDTSQTVNVATYYGSSSWTLIGTQPATLDGKEIESKIYVWVPATKGIYHIKFEVTEVAGPGNSTYISDYTIRVNMVGDIKPPYDRVNIVDVVAAAICYDSKEGQLKYNPIADVDGNGVINIVDIVIIAIHYGETDP